MKSNIALVGFMGSGKTTVGRMLAERIGLEFIDTDSIVETRAGMPVTSIWATHGQGRFREMEAEAVVESCDRADCVIAVGGGALGNPAALSAVRDACIVVFLSASTEAILERTGREDGRPLLHGLGAADRRYVVEDLLYDRTPVYQQARDIIVDADRPVPDVVEAILATLGMRET